MAHGHARSEKLGQIIDQRLRRWVAIGRHFLEATRHDALELAGHLDPELLGRLVAIETNLLHYRARLVFDEGLSAGEHSLVGHWYWPCVAAIEDGYYPGSCATPNALVEVLTSHLARPL